MPGTVEILRQIDRDLMELRYRYSTIPHDHDIGLLKSGVWFTLFAASLQIREELDRIAAGADHPVQARVVTDPS